MGERAGWLVFWDRHGVRVLAGAVGACVVGWVVVMVVLHRAGTAPGWWPGLDPTAPEVIAEAEKVERAFANQVSMVREGAGESADADWKVKVGSGSANAWLAVRLRAWVESEGVVWPEGVEQIRAGFAGDRVALGMRVTGGGVVWAQFTPEVRRDGSVWLKAHGAWVGTQRVPWWWALDGMQRELAKHAPEAAGTLGAVLDGEAPLMVEPVVRLPDGRRVRVLELAAVEDGVGVALRTEVGGIRDQPSAIREESLLIPDP
jgi:hypothetical protein